MRLKRNGWLWKSCAKSLKGEGSGSIVSTSELGSTAIGREIAMRIDQIIKQRGFSFSARAMLVLAFFIMALVPHASSFAQEKVDLQLVLAVDASGSVTQRRFDLQNQGYAAAFRNPQVQRAILSGPHQSIAVTLFQWTGPRLHVQIMPWMVIRDSDSAEAVAKVIGASQRQIFGGGTSISGALDYGMTLFAQMPLIAERRVIDVSGDGANTSGRSILLAREDVVKQGVTINGLPILSVEPDLDDYYARFVIGGDGAFVIPAKSYEDFGGAIVKKLIAEIAGIDPSKSAQQFAQLSEDN